MIDDIMIRGFKMIRHKKIYFKKMRDSRKILKVINFAG